MLLRPSEPSAFLPTRNTTAASADEESLPLTEDEINERASISSEMWVGVDEETPFFQTMAGAADEIPTETAIANAIAASFMVEELFRSLRRQGGFVL